MCLLCVQWLPSLTHTQWASVSHQNNMCTLATNSALFCHDICVMSTCAVTLHLATYISVQVQNTWSQASRSSTKIRYANMLCVAFRILLCCSKVFMHLFTSSADVAGARWACTITCTYCLQCVQCCKNRRRSSSCHQNCVAQKVTLHMTAQCSLFVIF